MADEAQKLREQIKANEQQQAEHLHSIPAPQNKVQPRVKRVNLCTNFPKRTPPLGPRTSLQEHLPAAGTRWQPSTLMG
jgi:hypothetical protein